MYTSVHSRIASTYQRVAADSVAGSADPHQIVGLLYAALMQNLNLARGALERQDLASKGWALGKAVRILDEGLKAGLDLARGGELAANLHGLYGYCIQRLTLANLRNDAQVIAEVAQLIEPLADGWKQIRAQAVLGA